MMTRSQVNSWNPSTLTDIGNAWITMGTAIEEIFSRYKSSVTNLNGTHWEGDAAEAALTRAENDRQSAVRVVDHLEHVAQIAINGFHQVNSPLQRTRTSITGAEAAGFIVTEALVVMFMGPLTPDRAAAMARWQQAISTASTETVTADAEVRAALNGARAALRVAFIAPAALGSDQARTDSNTLLNDPTHLTPEQIQRLAEAGSLTPDQLTALASGDFTDIPASQMEYLNALARSLDGKSSQEIETLLNQLPPEAREGVANALQLVSSPHVTASVRGDSEVPTYGRPNLLPEKMFDELTRSDLTTNSWEIYGNWGYNQWNLNGVAENQAAARIAGMSDPTLKHGTGLDRLVMDAAGKYLHAQNAADKDDMFFIDGRGADFQGALTEEMFHAVADDRSMVADVVSGSGGNALLSDVFTHEWTDDGKSVSELFDIDQYDAVADPNNGPDQALATQSGDIAESVARYMSNNSADLLRLPDDVSVSAGERNPELLKNVADDLAPYYSNFAGSNLVPGVGHFENTNELSDMYSVLASNPDSGVRAALATYAQQNALSYMYGSGDIPTTYAQIAGQMQHALETGTQTAQTRMDQGDVYQANWQAALDSAGYDAAKGAATTIADAAGLKPLKYAIDMLAPAVKPYVLGIVDPVEAANPNNGVPNDRATSLVDTNETTEAVAEGLVARDPSIINDPAFAEFRGTDSEGNPSIEVDNLDEQQAMRDLLYERGINVSDWRNAYLEGMHNGVIAAARPR